MDACRCRGAQCPPRPAGPCLPASEGPAELTLAPARAVLEIGGHLQPRTLAAAARAGSAVRLAPAAWDRIAAAHAALDRIAGEGAAIYGVSTGLGAAVDTPAAPGGEGQQRRVVMARMVGVGPLAAPDQVRAVMMARLAGLAVGRSGASPGIVAAYAALLNAGVLPAMPLVGSVGEADLAPLAHVAGVLAGAGEAVVDGQVMPGAAALAHAGIAPPPFGIKDGLALVSSNAASAGLGALVLADAERLFGAWLAAACLTLEGYRASVAPLRPAASALRPAPGQAEAAASLLGTLEGSALLLPGAARRLQDPLSLRCLAPVLGACLAALRAATAAVALELNTSDDNPAVLAECGAIQPNANFDSTHLLLAFEGLGLALSRAAAAQGARMLQLMSPASSGLPRFLSPMKDGRNGFATVQKTISALVAETWQHAMPMPPCALAAADGVEDYATMVVSGVRRLGALLAQLRLLCAVELMVGAQACDLRDGLRLGPGGAAVHGDVRRLVPMLRDDRPAAPDILALDALIGEGCFDDLAAPLFAAGPG